MADIEAHAGLDEVASGLTRLLARPVIELRPVPGGASRETWSFVSANRELILRRDPPGRPGPSGAMQREAAAMRACAAAGLQVPEVLTEDDGTALGTSGLVMTRVRGETIARHILRDAAYSVAREKLTGQVGRFLAGLHSIDPARVPGVEPMDSQRHFQEAYREVEDLSPTFELAFRRLAADRPPGGPPAVVHGDFRLGNWIVDSGGLAAVIDWELVHLGDPLEDLAWMCVKAWRFGGPGEAAGVGTVEELIGSYEAAGGRKVDREAFRWWLVEKTLEWGVMCMLQAAAHLSGANRSVELAAVGRRVAEQEGDLLELLVPDAWARALARAADAGEDDPGMYGRPTAAELLEASRAFLADSAVPATAGQVSFHLRVTVNVLGIVERQLRFAASQTARYREGMASLGLGSVGALCDAIRRGLLDERNDALVEFLATTVRDRLTVANPARLGR